MKIVLVFLIASFFTTINGAGVECNGQYKKCSRDCGEGCKAVNCCHGYFKCNNQVCIPNAKICNGVEDCAGGEDEVECNVVCKINEFSCKYHHKQICYPTAQLCDGRYDCDQWVDEIGCKYRERVACQNTMASLRCNPNEVIKIVSGFWGIVDERNDCPFSAHTIRNCNSSSAHDIIKKLCHDKHYCDFLAHDEVLSSTCPGYLKYVKVLYGCAPAYKRLVTCENYDVHIKCPPYSYIKIHRVHYGREDELTCTQGRTGDSNIKNKCYAPQANEIIENLCNSQQSCNFTANNALFSDPCPPMTYKYADVHYNCLSVLASHQ